MITPEIISRYNAGPSYDGLLSGAGLRREMTESIAKTLIERRSDVTMRLYSQNHKPDAKGIYRTNPKMESVTPICIPWNNSGSYSFSCAHKEWNDELFLYLDGNLMWRKSHCREICVSPDGVY